jgi:hypothetical protein
VSIRVDSWPTIFPVHSHFSLQTKQLTNFPQPRRAIFQPDNAMSSQRQINANRINAAKSRGPITPEGKLASSRNSLTQNGEPFRPCPRNAEIPGSSSGQHGLLSQVIIFDGESAERFNALHDSLIAEFKPETPTECGLVETMVVCRWRLMRVWTLENAAVSHEIRRQAATNGRENMPTQAALAYRTLSDDTRWLDVFNRYEARFDRQLSRAIQRFNEVRASRKKKKVIFPHDPNSGAKLK